MGSCIEIHSQIIIRRVFEDEERVIIKKIMKRIRVADDHPYFDDNNLDVPSVRANVGKILNSIKTLAPKP